MGPVKKCSPTRTIHHIQFVLKPKRRSARHAGVGGAIAEWWIVAESRAEAQDTACSLMEYDGWDIEERRGYEVQDACPYCSQDEAYAHYQRALKDDYWCSLRTWPKETDKQTKIQ